MSDAVAARRDGGAVELTDQTLLPDRHELIRCADDDALVEAITSLRVRGAPAIGVAAAHGIAAAAVRAVEDDAAPEAVVTAAKRAAAKLRDARPTAVNLARACDRMVAAAGVVDGGDGRALAGRLAAEADAIAAYERDACRAMGRHGADLLAELAAGREHLRVLSHCNTGPLCTGGIGTAFGVAVTLAERGRLGRLWVDETRPLLQGARITAWEAADAGLPHAVLADAAAGSLLAAGEVDAVVVGADRVAANGDVANKIGTYPLAVLAARHAVPFVVVAPTSTVDLAVSRGHDIEVEQRDPDEVRTARGATRLAPAGSPVHNPAFDVTPAELVGALVTERGAVRHPRRDTLEAHVGATGG